MPQVTRTTNDLIINSLYQSGELGVGAPPDAFMLNQGLEILNELIGKFTADGIYIPFLTMLKFNLVPGQAIYSVGDLNTSNIHSDRIVDLSFANYKVDTVAYSLAIISKAEYYNITRLDTLQARPVSVFLNRQPYESFLQFYPIPDQAYPVEIQAKIMLDRLDAHEDLSSLPPYYYGFLKAALTRRWKLVYPSSNWPPEAEAEYQEYYENLKNANETDLTIRPSTLMVGPRPYFWPTIKAY